MTEKSSEYMAAESGPYFQFLSEKAHVKLEKIDTNPFVRISAPDRSIPFVVLPNGRVIPDITANNPKIILNNIQFNNTSDKQIGAGYIDIYHGNKTLLFRSIESLLFQKKWLVADIVLALRIELNLYYPGYQIRSN